MTLLVPVLAGIGALCMSNPGRRRRKNSRRRNPGGSWVLVKQTSDGPRYVSSANSTTHDASKATKFASGMGARHYRSAWKFGAKGFRAKQIPSTNPGKRRKTKRKGKWVSPGSAASRLAWWRWHSNPGGTRDLTEHEFASGTSYVSITTWRNKNATAFIAVTARGPGGVKTWEAKSQGPSSGGYSKPDQAAERVLHKITGKWPHELTRETGHSLLRVIAAFATTKVGGDAASLKSNPRRRKSRRKSRR